MPAQDRDSANSICLLPHAQDEKPAAAAAPIFGSAAFGAGGFGATTGFGAATFGAASTFGSAEKKKADAEDDGAEGEGESADPEAECTATFKPLVQLEEVQVQSGEEDEDALFEACVPAPPVQRLCPLRGEDFQMRNHRKRPRSTPPDPPKW